MIMCERDFECVERENFMFKGSDWFKASSTVFLLQWALSSILRVIWDAKMSPNNEAIVLYVYIHPITTVPSIVYRRNDQDVVVAPEVKLLAKG